MPRIRSGCQVLKRRFRVPLSWLNAWSRGLLRYGACNFAMDPELSSNATQERIIIRTGFKSSSRGTAMNRYKTLHELLIPNTFEPLRLVNADRRANYADALDGESSGYKDTDRQSSRRNSFQAFSILCLRSFACSRFCAEASSR